ncbi:hypothetical protein N331_09028, partial [Merops nubicus]
KVIGVTFCFRELHLIHPFTGIPMEKCFSSEHGRELFRNPDEELLDGSVVADEGGRHLQAPRRYVAHGHFDVVGDPLHKVGAVLGLDGQQLLVHLSGRHPASEDAGHGQVAPAAGVAGGHHVARVKHLLGELWHREGSVLLAASSCQRGKARHEEMQAREGHHVNSQLPQVCVQLARETQRGCDSAH